MRLMTTNTTRLFLTIAVAAVAAPSPAPARPGFGGQATLSPAPTRPGFGQAAQASAEPPNSDEKRAIQKKMTELASRVEALAVRKADASLLADVDIYRKAAEFILRFPEEFATTAFTANTLSVLDTGQDGAPASSSLARVRPVSSTDRVFAVNAVVANSSGKRRMNSAAFR